MEEQNNQTAVMMIEVGVTRQPRQYQSVRVGVNLPVFVRQEDNLTVLLGYNLVLAMWAVRQQVDDEFETYDEPAPYSPEQRYMLLVCDDEQMMAIVPEQNKDGLPGGWREVHTAHKGHRLAYIQRNAPYEMGKYNLIDATAGDLTQLPPLRVFRVFRGSQDKLWILKNEDDPFTPEQYEGYFSSTQYVRLYNERFLAELRAKAEAAGAAFFDCTDGDFGKLPQPSKAEEWDAVRDDDEVEDDDEIQEED
jgi:uncharacterized protein YbdZ (MbtH family)